MSGTFQYLKFWFKATNQHGIHSPFIYRFVTNGLYIKHKYCRSKSLNIFLKCINYFKPKSVGFEDGNELLKKKVKDEFPSLSFKEPFEIKYYGALVTESQILAMANYAKQQPKGIIYIGDIRKNTYTIELWDKLILSDFVTVSVDMYFGGLLFFHKTQAREHFKIRI
ncbi:MAG: hypothetical protein WBN27_16775 [Eudoraea sp.]|uniref:hypothetical protein n=1 Tax=Eudoraea sp. TaxID=1979955 RepID=UPI003C723447